ncbi:hypothetical protein DRN69_02615 [Candidatus Pacearchaeota archaeon]|nr:MAG: hypothetical protein DRN69_02615 [Candidatus Pacearchaeota archaeon]
MKINAIICDMDGTLVEYPIPPFYSSWDALSLTLSNEKRKKWIETRDFYYPRKELYKEWYREQVSFLRGLYLNEVGNYLFPVPYAQGVIEFFSDKKEYIKGIISSGVSLVANRIVEELGFDFSVSNFIEVKGGRFTGRGETTMNLWRKDLDLLQAVEGRGVSLENVIYVGDNENDIPIFSLVEVSVAFRPKTEETKRAAKYVIDDFRELEEILEELK